LPDLHLCQRRISRHGRPCGTITRLPSFLVIQKVHAERWISQGCSGSLLSGIIWPRLPISTLSNASSRVRRPRPLTMNERPYQPADLLCVVEVYGRFHPVYWPRLITLRAAFSLGWAFHSRWGLLAPATRSTPHYVAEHDDILVGFGSYEDDGHLDFLFTHPDFARRGVATRLLQRIESAFVPLVFAGSSPKRVCRASILRAPRLQVDAEELIECRGVQLRRFAMHKQIPTHNTQVWTVLDSVTRFGFGVGGGAGPGCRFARPPGYGYSKPSGSWGSGMRG